MTMRTSRGPRRPFGLRILLLLVICLLQSIPASLGAQEKPRAASSRKAIAYYSDAAGYQNKGAFKLAVEEWQKLLDEFPKDPLASKAWHFLGVCYTQLDEPDYGAAADAFSRALQDKELEQREESLINLSWCLFTQARAAAPDSKEQRQGLEQARQRLTEFLRSYGDSAYADQALFYMGEIAYTLGDADASIPYYKKLLETDKLKESKLRPGAMYALAVAYEEGGREAQAGELYRQFIQEYADNRLAAEVRVRLSDLLLKQGQADEATELLESLATGDQGKMTDYALLRLGYALAVQGQHTQAIEYYNRLLENFPDSQHAATAALSLGQSLYQTGQYEAAVERFTSVLDAKDAQAAEAAHWLAITLMRLNKPQLALERIEPALQWAEQMPNYVSLRMDHADALYAIPEKLSEAQAAYEGIVEDYPEHALASRAAYNAAFAALQGGKVADARKWAELFLNRYPQDPLRNDVAAIAAEALLQQGEHAASATAYAKLREADPKNPAYDQWTLRQGMAHYLAGDYAAAISLLEPAAASLPQDNQQAEALYILGASRLYQENIAAAIEDLTASHRISDRWNSADEVLLLLAEAHTRNKDNESARATLENLLKKYPNTRLKAQVDYKLAQLSAAAQNYDEAIERYERIVDSADSAGYHLFASYGIVWCLMQQDKYAQALDRLGPLLEQGVTDSITTEAKLAEGICLRKTGQLEPAVRSLEGFLDKSPRGLSLANGLFELGLAHTELGQADSANKYFERIVTEMPDYPDMDRVLYELAWNHHENTAAERAVGYFQQLAERFPDSEYSPEAAYMLAQAHYDAQDFDSAASSYASVLERTQDRSLREKTQYKLGWSLFQQERYDQAAEQFRQQVQESPNGTLAVDALFMQAECAFKQEQYEQALPQYVRARETLEAAGSQSAASPQVRSLIYLHGAQCYRELARWEECEQWLNVIKNDYPDSPYLWTAVYELGYCKQRQEEPTAALEYYDEVVRENRNALGARARFMMGEVYFSQRDFTRAIDQFTRVAYGFGADKAPEDIKNWQAKAAFEAARCYEILASDLRGESRAKAVNEAKKFYEDIVRDHARHELAKQASTQLGELQKLR